MDLIFLSPLEAASHLVTQFYSFHNSKNKDNIVREVKEYVEVHVPGSRNILEAVALIADEMYMNAIFDAPTNPTGQHIFANKDRAEEVSIDESQPAQIFLCHDENWIIIGCVDPFGSLQVQPLLKRINETYKDNGMAHVRESGSGGAGLGCRLMFEYSTSMYIGVKKQQKTIFVCKLPLKKSHKAMANMPKNIHFLEVEGES